MSYMEAHSPIWRPLGLYGGPQSPIDAYSYIRRPSALRPRWMLVVPCGSPMSYIDAPSPIQSLSAPYRGPQSHRDAVVPYGGPWSDMDAAGPMLYMDAAHRPV